MELNKKDETALYNRYNVDDIFNRSVIVGLLDLMNSKITYEQIYENNVIETVHVPCMYDFGSSDERFAQDNYTFFGSACFGDKKIDGKFDMFPRCAIKYTGSNIDSGNITNKTVRGTYMKNENGKLVSYSALLYSIPLTFNFECEMWIDNMDTAFKIEQSIREIFYKNRTYTVLFRGMSIRCCVGFPESQTLNKTVSYAFDAERMIKLNFNLAVETYQPVFTEPIPTDNKIQYFGIDLTYNVGEPRDIYIKFDDNIASGTTFIAGFPTLITWKSKSRNSELLTLSLSYIDKRDNTEHQIDTPLYNEGYYIWNIPTSLTGYIPPSISYLVNENQHIIEEPRVHIVPQANGTITEDSFIVIEPGVFSPNDCSINCVLDYINTSDGNTEISADTYVLNIKNRQIDIEHPVSILPGKKPMIYKNSYSKIPISLKLTYPLDNQFYDQIDNLFII